MAFAAANLASLAVASAPVRESMDTFVQAAGTEFVRDPRHVGLSIGITRDGVPHVYNFGTTDRAANILPSDRTIYEIASATKTYTGILLAQAVIDGRIRLEDDVHKFLQDPYPNLSYGGKPICIVHLANHTSGLPKNMLAVQKGTRPAQTLAMYGDYTQERFLQDLQRTKIVEVPGTRFQYSNVGAQLLGIVLERAYGRSYEELIRQFITAPNRMVDTSMTVPAKDAARVAKGYDGNGARMPELSFWRSIPAAGYLKSTVHDQLEYLQWNLDESNPVIALSHRATFRGTGEQGDDIGLFWYSNRLADGTRVIRHGGGSFGSTSYLFLIPAARIGMVLLANDADPSTESALAAIAVEIAGRLR
jgi:CubicO group peptidase (beta-lactamase class C family)